MIIIQISDLNICERLHPFINSAFDRLYEFADRCKEDKVFLFAGNLFATRTFLSSEDISFFNKLLDRLKSYKLLFSMGINDFNKNAKDAKIAYKDLLESRNIPFISRPGIHEYYGLKWSFAASVKAVSSEQLTSDYLILYNSANLNTLPVGGWRGVICNGRKHFIDGRASCAGQLVQNNPEDGFEFGAIIWYGQKAQFLPLPQKWPAVKIIMRDDQEPRLFDFATYLIQVKFINCSREFCELAASVLQDKYSCPVDTIVENYFENTSVNVHDPAHQTNVMNELLGPAHPHRRFIIERFQRDVIPDVRAASSWKLNFIEWDNLFAYKSGNYVAFDELAKMTFIVGKNKSGKSSIIDIITLALFNRPTRCTISNVINKNAKKAYLRCVFAVNNKTYSIERSFERTQDATGKTTILQRFNLVELGTNKDLSKRNVAETYAAIQELLNLDYDRFLFNIDVQNKASFIGYQPKDKKKLIHLLLGTKYIENVHAEVIAEKKELRKQLTSIKQTASKKNSQMTDAEAEVRRLEGEVKFDANQLATFPQNLHMKTIFLKRFEEYAAAVAARQQLIVSGVKPLQPQNETESLKLRIDQLAALDELLGMRGITGHFFKKFADQNVQYINKVLARISDFNISLEVGDEGYVFYVQDRKNKIEASSASGYQKFLLDLVARIVFLHTSKLTNFGAIIIDEGFGCLDEDNFVKVARALNILKEYTSILIITHVEELKSYADRMIHVAQNKVQFGKALDLPRRELHEEKKKRTSASASACAATQHCAAATPGPCDF